MTALMALAALVAQQYEPMANWLLQDDHFSVSGAYCHGGGCTSLPRRLDGDVLFDFARSKAALANAARHTSSWRVMVDCKRVAHHFEQCQPANGQSDAEDVLQAAGRLLRDIRIDSAQLKSRRASPRAIVMVEYATGFCPYWRCTAIPPPPKPPAAY